jgi:hypothetical protein
MGAPLLRTSSRILGGVSISRSPRLPTRTLAKQAWLCKVWDMTLLPAVRAGSRSPMLARSKKHLGSRNALFLFSIGQVTSYIEEQPCDWSHSMASSPLGQLGIVGALLGANVTENDTSG